MIFLCLLRCGGALKLNMLRILKNMRRKSFLYWLRRPTVEWWREKEQRFIPKINSLGNNNYEQKFQCKCCGARTAQDICSSLVSVSSAVETPGREREREDMWLHRKLIRNVREHTVWNQESIIVANCFSVYCITNSSSKGATSDTSTQRKCSGAISLRSSIRKVNYF